MPHNSLAKLKVMNSQIGRNPAKAAPTAIPAKPDSYMHVYIHVYDGIENAEEEDGHVRHVRERKSGSGKVEEGREVKVKSEEEAGFVKIDRSAYPSHPSSAYKER